MLGDLKIDDCNLTLINLEHFLPDVEINILNDLYRFGLTDDFNINKKDTISLIYHHLILNICERVKECQDPVYKVVIYHPEMVFLPDLTEIQTGNALIMNILRKLATILPINFYELPFNVRYLERVLADNGGEAAELKTHLGKFTDIRRKSLYSFRKIEKFGAKYNLDFLTKTFFKKVENRQLIIG